jgi:hypothetical protein
MCFTVYIHINNGLGYTQTGLASSLHSTSGLRVRVGLGGPLECSLYSKYNTATTNRRSVDGNTQTFPPLHGFRLPPWRWNPRSSGTLRSVEWYSFADVSGQRIGPIFNDPLKMGPISCPETSVKDYHSTLHNNPEERGSRLPLCPLVYFPINQP